MKGHPIYDRVTPVQKMCEMNSHNYSEKTQHFGEKYCINKYINLID